MCQHLGFSAFIQQTFVKERLPHAGKDISSELL